MKVLFIAVAVLIVMASIDAVRYGLVQRDPVWKLTILKNSAYRASGMIALWAGLLVACSFG